MIPNSQSLCPQCGIDVFGDPRHVCPPAWWVTMDPDYLGAVEVFAYSEEQAIAALANNPSWAYYSNMRKAATKRKPSLVAVWIRPAARTQWNQWLVTPTFRITVSAVIKP